MSTVIYHERFLQRLLDQRYHWEIRERDTRKALYEVLTIKQLSALTYRGKLRTKSQRTLMLLGAWKLDRVRSDKAAS